MKRYLTFVVLVLASVTLACTVSGLGAVRGTGDVVQEERSIGSFSGIELANQGDVIIELGSAESLVVEAEENLLEYLVTEVRGDTLYLGTKSGTSLSNTEPIRYHVTAQELDSIQIASSGSVTAPALTADSFSIQVSSSGDVEMDGIEASRLVVRISSSGSVTIDEGMAEAQEIDISSSGDYEASNVDSLEAEVNISSSGRATIRVSDSLDAALTSSGNVYYYGDPQLNVSASSSGRAIQQGQ